MMRGFARFSLCGVAAVLGAVLMSPAHAQESVVDIAIAADAPGPVIDRNVFGQFAEHLGSGIHGGIWVGKTSPIPNVRGIRSDVVAALRAIHVPNVRWPGGCFADEYHWRDGVGPADKRRVQINSNWGGVAEDNAFGTDEFMDFAGQIGADAYVSVNVGSGTPEEAAAWLEYMTAPAATTLARERAANGHAAPYRVPLLGLGNENWGCGGAMSPDHYVEEMKRFAHYVHNDNPAQRGTDAMKRIAVGWDAGKSDYTEAVMKAWADKVYSWDIEGVSLHNYTVGGWPPHLPATGFGLDDYATVIGETYTMDTLITRQSALMDRYDPQAKVFLAVDEWGAWLAPTPGTNPGFLMQQNSLRDAILAAVNLNIFARHAARVKVANIAQMINVLQAMILTDGAKLVLTPTYHVYHLYVPFQGATVLPVTYDAGHYVHGKTTLPRLDAIAARDRDGHVWLSLVNVDPEHGTRVHLPKAHAATGHVLTAAAVDAVNTFANPAAVTPRAITAHGDANGLILNVPPHSVMVVRIDP
jgi:alpha-N-arabinofuranosidase